jgi:hypothetical protein
VAERLAGELRALKFARFGHISKAKVPIERSNSQPIFSRAVFSSQPVIFDHRSQSDLFKENKLMKSVRWFLLLVALVTVGPLLTACTESDTNSETPSSSSPAPGGSNASSASSPAVASPYPGAVDRRDCEEVAGWVVNKDNPKAETKVELYIDDKLIGTVPAATLRPDLTSWSSGLHGFRFKIPAAYKDGKPHTAKVKVAGSNYEVPFYQSSPGFECKAS